MLRVKQELQLKMPRLTRQLALSPSIDPSLLLVAVVPFLYLLLISGLSLWLSFSKWQHIRHVTITCLWAQTAVQCHRYSPFHQLSPMHGSCPSALTFLLFDFSVYTMMHVVPHIPICVTKILSSFPDVTPTHYPASADY